MPVIDEDIVRDLLHRYTDHLQPPESIATQVAARQLRLHRRRVASLTATGAALATAAGVIAVVPGHASRAPGFARPATSMPSKTIKQPALTLTAEQRKLDKLSSVAASQPPGQGRYAVMMTGGGDVKDTSVIDSRTGDMWSYQQGTDGLPSGKGFTRNYSPTAAQLAAMPTGLVALRAALIAQWDEQNKPGPNPNNVAHKPDPVQRQRQGVPAGDLPAMEPTRRPGPAVGALPGARDRARSQSRFLGARRRRPTGG